MKIAKETAKKILIILLIVFGGLTLLGGIVFTIGFAAAGWSFSAFNTVTYQRHSYTETQEIYSISLEYDTTDIKVYFDETATQVRVEYADKYKKGGALLCKTSFIETDGKLVIKEERTRHFYLGSYIGEENTTILYLPANRTYTLNMETDTGDIFFYGNATLNSLELETETGTINLNNCTLTCNGEMEISANTGNLFLKDFTAKSLELETSTGDITFSGFGIVESKVEIEVSTGDISLGDLSGASLVIKTSTGNVKSAGKGALDFTSIQITTSTGDVYLNLIGKHSEYSIQTHSNTGDVRLSGMADSSLPRQLSVRSSTGDIKGQFIENHE